MNMGFTGTFTRQVEFLELERTLMVVCFEVIGTQATPFYVDIWYVYSGFIIFLSSKTKSNTLISPNMEEKKFWVMSKLLWLQDGKIEAEVKLTGILSLGALQPGESRKYGTTIAPGLYAPVHQHFFVARMDMAVDCKPGEAYNQVCTAIMCCFYLCIYHF